MNQLTHLSQAVLHSRRTFLLRTAGTVVFPLALAACGGGDDAGVGPGTDTGSGTGTGTGTGSGSGSGTTSVVPVTRSAARGTVVLPTGATVRIASVENGFGASAPAADGSFDFVSIAESEMFAIAIGTGGKMVLAGLLQAGSTTLSTQLSARSTAVCLAYTVLGVGVYLPATQEQYLVAIQASPTLLALEAAVSAAIVARGEGWLDLTDPALKGALAAVQAALSPSALTAAAAASGAAVDSRHVHIEGMVIDRTARVSGLQVTGDGVGSITLTNYYRRRSYAYIDRVSYQDTFTGTATPSPAAVGAQPMMVDATKSITNSLVTLAQLYAGVKDFYDPVVYSGIPTPIAPAGAALTTYRVTSVGLGVAAGDLALLDPVQHAGLRNVCAETVVLDIVVPIFCGILIPIRSASMTTFIQAFAAGAIKDVVSTFAASDDVLLNKIVAANRPLDEVLWDTLLAIVNSDSLKNAILGFCQQMIDSLPSDSVLPRTNVVNVGAKALLDAISAADLAAQAMDLVVTGLSFASSDLADRFEIDVTKSAVRLNPQSPQLDPAVLTQTNLTLSVIDSDLTADDLSYRWSGTCAFGDIADGTHVSSDGTAFDSNSANLAYTPRGRGRGGDQDTVTGIVYKGHVLATRVPIGTATSTITYATAIVPASVQLLINTQQTFTADMSSAVLASGAALNYVWSVSGGGTVNGVASVTTTTPTVVYKAGATTTTDTLSLVVTRPDTTVLTRATATIGVLGSVVAGIAPQNPQVVRSTVVNFAVSPVGASFPSGATFKWVLTHKPDLFGRPLDIGASGGGTIGVTATPLPQNVNPGASVTVTTTNPTIAFAANPFGTESNGTTFAWNPSLTLAVTVIGAGGGILATSSTTIYTQIPTSILLP